MVTTKTLEITIHKRQRRSIWPRGLARELPALDRHERIGDFGGPLCGVA